MLLKEYRSKARGLSDLLNYAALVDDGIILNKDGSFTAGWFYAGPDLDAAGHIEMATLSSQVNQALATLGDGWMIHVDALRLPSMDYPDTGAFPDPVTHLIDEERRRHYRAEGAHYESVYVLTVTYLSPTDTESRLSRMFVSGSGTKGADVEASLRTFKSQIDAIQDMLSARLSVVPMTSEDLLTHLHLCITGLNHHVRMPAIPCYLDTLLASQDLIGGFEPRIGDKHLRTINIGGFPQESFPGILDFLNRMPIEYRWSTRFIFLDPATAERRLTIMRRNWFQKRHGLFQLLWQALNNTEATNFENRDAIDMADDADEALSEASGGAVRYGYYTCTLILMSEDGAGIDALAREVRKEFANRGFPARIETINALESYLGSLPGHGYQNVRRSPIHTLNLADLLPITSVWPGLEHNPCSYYPSQSPALLTAATSGSTPFRLNIHVSDVGHTLIVGPTGSGKTTLVGLIQAQFFRYEDARVFTFDMKYSSFALINATGGTYYDIGGEDQNLGFCPLAHIDEPQERLWASDWLETLFELQGVKITPKQRGLIQKALTLLAHDDLRSLTDLQNTLQDETLRSALNHYTLNGALGGLLDASHDTLRMSAHTGFEMQHLLSLGSASSIPVLLYLLHSVERCSWKCALITISEAWFMLLHSRFADKIEQWLRIMRDRNAAIVFDTQSLAEIKQSKQSAIIIDSCLTKIFAPNSEARNEETAALYRSVGLNDRQIELLAYAIPKREYLYTSPLGRRLIDLDLGPVALSFVGATGKDDLAAIRQLIKSHGSAWPARWLARRHLLEASAEWQALSKHTKGDRKHAA